MQLRLARSQFLLPGLRPGGRLVGGTVNHHPGFRVVKAPSVACTWLAATVTVLALTASAVMAAPPATLLDAVESGDRTAALRLLAKGANPNTPGPDGTTPIMWAAANDDTELVRALVKAGAKVDARNHFGTSALTEAATSGSASIIDVLLKAGADPNSANPEGETPLMAAARSGRLEAA